MNVIYFWFKMDWLNKDKIILELEDIKNLKPNFDVINILSRETCEQVQVLIFDKQDNELKILTTNNFSEQLKKILWMLSDRTFSYKVFYTSVDWFNFAMKWYDEYDKLKEEEQTKIMIQKQAKWQSALVLIKELYENRNSKDPWEFILDLIKLVFQSWASDLHFQAQKWSVLVRVRIDWVLQTILTFDNDDFRKYLQKLKFISWVKLNIDYIPQDWRFSFDVDKNWVSFNIDARVNFMPGVWSESTVIRFLDSSKWVRKFEETWFYGKNYDILKKNLEKTTWMVLITWPTWSWKTTTLYSILNYLNTWKEKIITLEDPIEYQLKWIQQSQIIDDKWYSYELWLKAILRHDPDIVLVWEIRTLETAEISINASLTWHMVLSTLHTNSAIETISRLLNIGVKPYILAPSLNLIIWQRLVRKICPHCATKRDVSYAEKTEIEETLKKIKDVNPQINVDFDWKVVQAMWCDKCNNTWYIWRIAVLEVFEITDNIRTMILEWKSTITIFWKAREQWYLTMKEDAILKLLEWKTTLDEIRRVL